MTQTDPLTDDKIFVDTTLTLILCALRISQLNYDLVGAVLCEVISGELEDIAAINDRSDKVIELTVTSIGAFGRPPQKS